MVCTCAIKLYCVLLYLQVSIKAVACRSVSMGLAACAAKAAWQGRCSH